MATADFNHDGKPDLAVGDVGDTAAGILLNVDGGQFGALRQFPVGSCSRLWVSAGNLRADAGPDLVVATYLGSSYAVSVLLNNYFWVLGGGFSSQVPYTMPRCPYSVALADFDRDGLNDLAVPECGPNVEVLLNQGGGTFADPASAPFYPVGGFPESATVGDFNGDGRPDLVVPSESGASVSILINSGNWSGDAGFLPEASYAVGSTPFVVAVADFDHSGRVDVASANSGANTVSVLLNLGDGGFGPQAVYPVGTTPYGIAAADLDGDGFADLVVTNSGSATLTVLHNDGTGHFADGGTYAVGTAPQSIAVVDLNMDGAPDLVTANSGSNDVTVLYGSCR